MWLRNKLFFADNEKHIKLSTRITLFYAAMITVMMLIADFIALYGLNFVLFHQAAVETDISIKKTLHQLELGNITADDFGKQETLLPGVVLRAFNDAGEMVYDSNSQYFKMKKIEEHMLKTKPIWADMNRFEICQFRSVIISRRDLPIVCAGRPYKLVFLKTITAENNAIAVFKQIVLGANIIGILLTMLVGYYIIKKSLQPVRRVTEAAKAIQVDDLSKRIVVNPAGDEVTEMANTFNTMLERLERGFVAQQKFVSDASHELRTPITIIRGYADILARWGNEDPNILKESIEAIRSEAENMQELIEELLFLARADQKRQTINKVVVDMKDFVEDAYKGLEIMATNHSVELLAADSGIVLADKTTMKQLLRIFLENSMKYTPKGGYISIAGKLDKEYNRYIVIIADDGIGIASEDQKKIFQRFYRVDESRTRAAGAPSGTGLGLSIASWIAKNHDIEIKLESELEKGTKIILSIPLLENEQV